MKTTLMATTAMILTAAAANAAGGTTWKSWNITNQPTGTPICGMSSALNSGPNVFGEIMIKYIKGNPALSIHVWKNTWKFGSGIPVKVRVLIDNIARVSDGETFNAEGSDNSGVAFWVTRDKAVDFLTDFSNGNKLVLEFSGNEPQWTTNLMGSDEVTKVFVECIRSVGGIQEPAPSKPFNDQPTDPTNPFKGPSGPPVGKFDPNLPPNTTMSTKPDFRI